MCRGEEGAVRGRGADAERVKAVGVRHSPAAVKPLQWVLRSSSPSIPYSEVFTALQSLCDMGFKQREEKRGPLARSVLLKRRS